MSADRRPQVVVIAGPNGAGKSSAAEALLRGRIGIEAFVNADVIAAGLNPGNPQSAAIEAGHLGQACPPPRRAWRPRHSGS